MVPAATERKGLERAERTFPGRLEPRHRPLRLHRRTPPPPQPRQKRRRPHQNPPRHRPRTRAHRHPHLPVAGQRRPGAADDRRPAQRRPRSATPPRTRTAAGPLRDCITSWPTPNTPATWSSAGAAASGPCRPVNGSGPRSPPTPPSWTSATWDAAQRAGAEHGNVRDTELPSTRPGRHYRLRSRLWCKICRRRMRGAARTGPAYRAPYIYYRCPHDRSIPRHAAAHPDTPHRHRPRRRPDDRPHHVLR